MTTKQAPVEEAPPPPKMAAPGYFRVVSPSQWQLEHKESYEAMARRRGWLDDDEDDGWG